MPSNYEVDFLAIDRRGQKKLFQVVWDISDTKTYERELRALEAAKKELGIAGEMMTLEQYLESGIHFD